MIDVFIYDGFEHRDKDEADEYWEEVSSAPRLGERVSLRKDLGKQIHSREVLHVEWFKPENRKACPHVYVVVGVAVARSVPTGSVAPEKK